MTGSVATRVICTLADGNYGELHAIARPSLDRFSIRHRCDVVVADKSHSGGRPLAWGKIALVRELLDEYESVAWIDADAVIVDGRTDIFTSCTRLRPMALAIHRYDGLEVPNAGVFVIHSCRWTKKFLEAVWAADRYTHHAWWDNAALIHALGYDVASPRRWTRRSTVAGRRVAELDLSWNCIPRASSETPRIRHFPGMSHADRIREMTAAAAGAQ